MQPDLVELAAAGHFIPGHDMNLSANFGAERSHAQVTPFGPFGALLLSLSTVLGPPQFLGMTSIRTSSSMCRNLSVLRGPAAMMNRPHFRGKAASRVNVR
jgi:hypothetical protein